MTAHHDAALATAIDRAHRALDHATRSLARRYPGRTVSNLRSARNAVMAAQMIAERIEAESDRAAPDPTPAVPELSR